jgi:hypothetical protein
MLPTSLLCGVGCVLSLAALSQLAPLYIPLSNPLVSVVTSDCGFTPASSITKIQW